MKAANAFHPGVYQMNITFRPELCSLDGRCANACPVHIVTVDKVGKVPRVTISDDSGCLGCYKCIEVCTEGALFFQQINQYTVDID